MSAHPRVLDVEDGEEGGDDVGGRSLKDDEVFQKEEEEKERSRKVSDKLSQDGALKDSNDVADPEVSRGGAGNAGDLDVFHSFQHLFIMESGSSTSLTASLPNVSSLDALDSFGSDFEGLNGNELAAENLVSTGAEDDFGAAIVSGAQWSCEEVRVVDAEPMDQSFSDDKIEIGGESVQCVEDSNSIATLEPTGALNVVSQIGEESKRSPKRSISVIFDEDPVYDPDADSDRAYDHFAHIRTDLVSEPPVTRLMAQQQSNSIIVNAGSNSSLGSAFQHLEKIDSNPSSNQEAEDKLPSPPLQRQFALRLSQDVIYSATLSSSQPDSNNNNKNNGEDLGSQSENPSPFMGPRRFGTDTTPPKFPPSSDLANVPLTTANDFMFTNGTSTASEMVIPSKASAQIASSSSDPPTRDSPKRPPEEPPEEEGKISPKRLSLQFRPDRISSTSTPFVSTRPVLPSSKGVRALSFDSESAGNGSESTHNHPQHPNRKARLSFNPSETPSLQSIAENEDLQFPTNNGDDCDAKRNSFIARNVPFMPSLSDQSSIIAHGFPSSFFYSPSTVEARSTSGATAGAAPTPSSRQRRSMPPNISAVVASPSTQRFREALTAELSRRRLSLADQSPAVRRLSLDDDRRSSTFGQSSIPSLASSTTSSDGFAPFSPSKHPMMTRSSASVMSVKDQDVYGSRWPMDTKASLYSLYEALSQESGYWTRSRCRDVTTESQLASVSQSVEVPPSSISSSIACSHAHSHANSADARFCCVPDTPSHFFLRRPMAKCKRDAERVKEEEKTRRKKEIAEKVDEYLYKLKSLPPDLWIGRRIGIEKFDIVSELNRVEPGMVFNIISYLDDPALKSFSLVSASWSSSIQSHKSSRLRLQMHEDLILALSIQTRENTPVNPKPRRSSLWSGHGSGGTSSLVNHSASSSVEQGNFNRSFLFASELSFNESYNSGPLAVFNDSVNNSINSSLMAYTPENRVALKPVQRRASVNSVSRNDVSSLAKPPPPPPPRHSSQNQGSPTRSRSLRSSARSPRSKTFKSPRGGSGELRSPSRRNECPQSPRRTARQPFNSPSRRENFQTPSRVTSGDEDFRSPASGNEFRSASGRSATSGFQSPRRAKPSGSPSPSRRPGPSGMQSPTASDDVFKSPSRNRERSCSSPSKDGAVGGCTLDQNLSPKSRVLSPCRIGAQFSPRFGQRRLFASPTKAKERNLEDDEKRNSDPSMCAIGAVSGSISSSDDVSDIHQISRSDAMHPYSKACLIASNPNVSLSSPSCCNVAHCGTSHSNASHSSNRPSLRISALTNHARSLPKSPSLESSSRNLFDSPAKDTITTAAPPSSSSNAAPVFTAISNPPSTVTVTASSFSSAASCISSSSSVTKSFSLSASFSASASASSSAISTTTSHVNARSTPSAGFISSSSQSCNSSSATTVSSSSSAPSAPETIQSTSGYILRSQVNANDAKTHARVGVASSNQVDSSQPQDTKDNVASNNSKTSASRVAKANRSDDKTPLCASNYHQSPTVLSARKSLNSSQNKSLNKSKQRLKRL